MGLAFGRLERNRVTVAINNDVDSDGLLASRAPHTLARRDAPKATVGEALFNVLCMLVNIDREGIYLRRSLL
jgi:hypothetical protein